MKVDLKKIAKESKDRYSKDLTGLKEMEQSGEVLQKLRGYANKVVSLPLHHLTISDNVRKNFRAEGPDFDDLVDSIRANGLLQNLVASLLEFDNGKWELRVTAGQRRYYACQKVGMEKVPVMIRIWNSEAEELYAGLSENLNRVDLSPLHVADAYARLLQLGMTANEIAERVDRQKRTIRKYLSLSKLPADVRQVIDEQPEVFTTGVLFNEVASRNFGSDDELRKHIQDLIRGREVVSSSPNGLEAADVNSQVGGGKTQSKSRKSRKVDPVLYEEIVRRISGSLPVKVKVKGTHDKGQVLINYASREQLEQLLSQLEK
jgi:ParB family transcriptional regulator, chromosome partitioning protein